MEGNELRRCALLTTRMELTAMITDPNMGEFSSASQTVTVSSFIHPNSYRLKYGRNRIQCLTLLFARDQ